METIDIDQALQQIHQLLENAALGAEIMITKNDLPMVKLVSPYPRQKRPTLFGSDKGMISIYE
ncbi:type II toxin-antitoxin system Phd/YefM family antitoxin [Coleofasciculus sp. F4-SAH-05]|uniref:type II toxin-antitoxin system Phd/YefM family antitoxin n=1 Tax=Coleofasciculus sp. F4-SAH-05 TaxID=3069525 RepID=UPI0032F4368F